MERKDLTFTDAIKICFSKFADFSGRARRQEYWYFTVFNMVIQAGLNALGRLVFGSDSSMASIFAGIFSLVILIYYFFMLIPVVGWIIVLIQLCKDSQPGENQYGVSPKYPNKYYK